MRPWPGSSAAARSAGRYVPGGQRRGEHGGDERPLGAQRRRAGHLPGQRVPDDHAGPVPGQSLPAGEPRVRQRPARGLQRQPVGRVGGQVGGLGDAEPGPVELPSFQHGGPGDGSAAVRTGQRRGPRPGRPGAPSRPGGIRRNARRPARALSKSASGSSASGNLQARPTMAIGVALRPGAVHSGMGAMGSALVCTSHYLFPRSRELHARPATSIVSPEMTDFAAFARGRVARTGAGQPRRCRREYATAAASPAAAMRRHLAAWGTGRAIPA